MEAQKEILKKRAFRARAHETLVALVGLFLSSMSSTSLAVASWTRLTDAELIAQSDLIALGEIVEESSVTPPGSNIPLWAGTLRLEEVWKGPSKPDTVHLVLPSPRGPRKSDDIVYRKGQRGLWFLRSHQGGTGDFYLADHPQRFIPATNTEAIEKMRKTVEDTLKKR